jgi:hypothetical protein
VADTGDVVLSKGMGLIAGVAIAANQRGKLERLCRYVSRPRAGVSDSGRWAKRAFTGPLIVPKYGCFISLPERNDHLPDCLVNLKSCPRYHTVS